MPKARTYWLISTYLALSLPAIPAGHTQEQTNAPESVLWTSISTSDPVKITRVLYNGRPIENRASFQGDAEWVKGLSVEVENASHKTLTYIDFQITFRTVGPFAVQYASAGQFPEHRRLAQDGSGRIDQDPNEPISVAPGQRIIVPFEPAFPRIQNYISKLVPKRQFSEIHYCDIVPGQAYFSDGSMWQIGQFFKETHEKVNTYDRSTPEEFYGETAVSQRNSTTLDGYAWQWTAVKPPPDPTDEAYQSLLVLRGAYFDRSGSPVSLDQQSGLSYGMSVSSDIQEEFPAATSDAVVVAKFASYTPHLSPSKRSIYTEATMLCEKVAFSEIGGLISGAAFPVLFPGGTLVLPGTNKVVSYGIAHSQYALVPGETYLLFLHYEPRGEFYEVIKFWRIENQKLIVSSVFDQRKVDHGVSLHAGEPLEKAITELRESKTAR